VCLVNGVPESGQPDAIAFGDQDVSGLDVTVQQTVAVKFADGVGETDRHAKPMMKLKRAPKDVG
jgi:hypothetical protein